MRPNRISRRWNGHASWRPSMQPAMTLLELLVVVAILAVILGLLFPAVQMARESARRSACGNNLRQIALAMMTFGDSHKALPGWRNETPTFSSVRAKSDPKTAAVSWTVPILPNLEQLSVYGWYASYSDGQSAAADASQSPISEYRCPSHDYATTRPALSYAVNAGNGGEILDDGTSPARQYSADGFFGDAVGNRPATPLFDSSRPVYTAAETGAKMLVADGTTCTIMLSERSGPAVPQGISWSANPRVAREYRGALPENHTILHPLPVGSGWRTEIQVINPTADTRPLPSPVPGSADLGDWNVRYPSSRHPRAVNVAFCDGHVRIIRDRIDAWVYCQLLSSDSKSVSPGVADWQQYFDASGSLVPYTFRPDDLIR